MPLHYGASVALDVMVHRDGDVSAIAGIEVLLGKYSFTEASHCGYLVFVKSDDSGLCLYYCDSSYGDQRHGWWFGDANDSFAHERSVISV